MRILHLADLHLGWQPDWLGEKSRERAGERDTLLSRAADFALDKGHDIQVVTIAGDLFETHRPPRALVEHTLRELERMVNGGLFVVTVPGNHDEITYVDSVYRVEQERWPGVLAVNPHPAEIARFEREGKTAAFYGLAYTAGITKTAVPLHEFPKNKADLHIGIFHGSLDWDAGDRSLPISGSAAGNAGYDCFVLGHFHQPSVRYLGRTVACYAGATEAKTFHDPGCAAFTVVTLKEVVTVEQVPVFCRPCFTKTLDVSLCDRPEDVADAIRMLADSQAMVRVILTGVSQFFIPAADLRERLAHLFYHLDVEGEGLFLHDKIIMSLAKEPTIRGLFVRNLLKRLEAAESAAEQDVVRRALLRGIAALQGGGS